MSNKVAPYSNDSRLSTATTPEFDKKIPLYEKLFNLRVVLVIIALALVLIPSLVSWLITFTASTDSVTDLTKKNLDVSLDLAAEKIGSQLSLGCHEAEQLRLKIEFSGVDVFDDVALFNEIFPYMAHVGLNDAFGCMEVFL